MDGKGPGGIDHIVGHRVRFRRRELKMTQDQLAQMLGLTFQQVQKYEKGMNRISAGRLFELARVLQVQVSYFFDGAEEMLEDGLRHVAEDEEASAPVLGKDDLELIAAFQRIGDPDLRKAIFNLVKSAADAKPDDTDA